MDLVWGAAVAVASVIALALALFSWRRSSGVNARIPQGACLPPGPRGLPLVGDVATFLGNLTPQKGFAWSQTHGPVISRHLPYHVVTYRDRDVGDFMDAYLRNCDEGGRDMKPRYSMSSLIGNAGSLVLAGGSAVSAVLVRLLLLLATNVDTVQDRIHREIDDFIGSERQPTWEDRHFTPYTLATIWEAHRWNTLLPLGAPRR
ncbi:hypothetical protein HPB52_024001 [Rhipicephalus sanguineus]|uniref:Cytochrome P450 n=1 Tax=Rhipicephalus sanguineus TaxID=34632 RepID=A0A9D4Q3Y1_RHISA|nr:hypothetical protein HPB52_024001 [Rhipicephalus sanguineus]